MKLFGDLSAADISTSYRIEYLSGFLRHAVDLVDSDYLLSDDKRSAIIDMILQSPPIRSMERLWALKGITFARHALSDKPLATPSQQAQLKIALLDYLHNGEDYQKAMVADCLWIDSLEDVREEARNVGYGLLNSDMLLPREVIEASFSVLRLTTGSAEEINAKKRVALQKLLTLRNHPKLDPWHRMRAIEEILRSRTADNKILATAEEMGAVIAEGIAIIKSTDVACDRNGIFASTILRNCENPDYQATPRFFATTDQQKEFIPVVLASRDYYSSLDAILLRRLPDSDQYLATTAQRQQALAKLVHAMSDSAVPLGNRKYYAHLVVSNSADEAQLAAARIVLDSKEADGI